MVLKLGIAKIHNTFNFFYSLYLLCFVIYIVKYLILLCVSLNSNMFRIFSYLVIFSNFLIFLACNILNIIYTFHISFLEKLFFILVL